MTDHKQVECHGIKVDEKLTQLLPLLWERGWVTQFSCQGHPSADIPELSAYIMFMDKERAWDFYKVVMDKREFGWYVPAQLEIASEDRGVVRFAQELIESIIHCLKATSPDDKLAYYQPPQDGYDILWASFSPQTTI